MKSQELAKILKQNIDLGVYHESGKLPTEDALIKEFNVTRYCVRNAVNSLVELGCVYQVQGSGMYVRESKKVGCLSLSNTKGLTAEFADKEVETRVITFELIEADDKIAARMKCDAKTPIYYIVRLRTIDGQPFTVEYNYYNKNIVRFMNREIAEGSLYNYLRKDIGLNIGFADKIIYCEKLQKEDADLLQLKEGDPGMVVEDDAYLSNGQMFDASKVIYHYKQARFFNLADMK